MTWEAGEEKEGEGELWLNCVNCPSWPNMMQNVKYTLAVTLLLLVLLSLSPGSLPNSSTLMSN